MIGRLLCRLGLHRWEFKTAIDRSETDAGITYVVTDYAWCKRRDCDGPNHISNVERRTLVPN